MAVEASGREFRIRAQPSQFLRLVDHELDSSELFTGQIFPRKDRQLIIMERLVCLFQHFFDLSALDTSLLIDAVDPIEESRNSLQTEMLLYDELLQEQVQYFFVVGARKQRDHQVAKLFGVRNQALQAYFE